MKHWTRKLTVKLTTEEIDRFWSKVDRSGDCWVWLAGRDKANYGKFSFQYLTVKAHWVGFYSENGRWPYPCCLHTCDNPRCVRPSHLWEGTVQENNRDKWLKGRYSYGDDNGSRRHPERLKRGDENPSRTSPETLPRGSLHGCAKVTEADVLTMRKMKKRGVVQRRIAERFGLSETMVSDIVRGRRWKHVPMPN